MLSLKRSNMEMECVSDSYDLKAIPPDDIQTAIDHMAYASQERVMFRALVLTGCRIACLDKWRMSHLHGNYIYWEVSKTGGKYRKEFLPSDYLLELADYRNNSRVDGKRVFGITGETFVRYFNRDIRPRLGKAWNAKRLKPKAEGFDTEYVLQIKGLRKSFQTYDFARNYAKWHDAGVALEMTSKRMKHSTTHITAHHYIENFDALGIKKVTTDLDPIKALSLSRQMRIMDFN